MATNMLVFFVVVTLSGFAQGQTTTTNVRCDSNSYRYTECAVPQATGLLVPNSITVVQQHSRTTCDSSNYGIDPVRRIVWVNKGCRATFSVGYYTVPVASTSVTCESFNFNYVQCTVSGANGNLVPGSMYVAQQLSNTPCIPGRFGIVSATDKTVYANGGCRATFDVFFYT